MHITAKHIKNNMTPNTNFGLCHGVAGSAELFLNDSIGFGNEGREIINEIKKFGYETFYLDQRPWYYSEESYRMPIGLMTGLAGTGLFYLRTVNKSETSSILLLRELGLEKRRCCINPEQGEFSHSPNGFTLQPPCTDVLAC
jgi:lantibiotic modifying enzyme